MKFRRIEVRGVGAFEELDVDLSELPGPLVAVCGANGAGKSTLLELLLGGIYRDCPTRGALIDLATGRNSSVRVDFSYSGRPYTIRQLLDGTSRKGESTITNGDGRPLVESTKVSAVAAYVEQHFPALDVLLVSTFAAQQSQGFIDAKPGERKSLLLRILGIEHIEQLATDARAQANETDKRLSVLQGRIRQEQHAHPTTIAAAETELATREQVLQQLADFARRCAADLKTAEAEQADAQRRVEKQAAWFKERNALADELLGVGGKIADLEARRVNNLKLTDRAKEITDGVERARVLRTLCNVDAEEHAGLTASLRAAVSAKATRQARRVEIETAMRRHAATAQSRAQVDEAKARVAALGPELARLENDEAAAARVVAELTEKGSADRITGLRIGLAAIRDSHSRIEAAVETATATLQRDDVAKAAATGIPEANAQLRAISRELVDTRETLTKANRTAALEPGVAAAEAGFRAEEAARDLIDQELAADAQTIAGLQNRAGELDAQRAANAVELEANEKLAKFEAPLQAAAAKVEEYNAQLVELRAKATEIETRIAALGDAPSAPPAVSTARLQAVLDEAQRLERSEVRAVAEAEAALTAARAAAERVADLERQQDTVGQDLADWVLLSKDLGKDGLQATLIDAALPELVAMTNSLLHTNFGPRFTVDIRSQAANSTGKRLLETLDVIVMDSESGREAAVETYSGGERAIIGEAVSLGLTTLASRESGLAGSTLIRDEAGAALDAKNGRAWIGMLRQAVTMMGADKLLFVSHSPELAELADSRIDL